MALKTTVGKAVSEAFSAGLMEHAPGKQAGGPGLVAGPGELKEVECPTLVKTYPGALLTTSDGVPHFRKHRLDVSVIAAEGGGILTIWLRWLDANKREIGRTDALTVITPATWRAYSLAPFEQPAGCCFVALRISFLGDAKTGGVCMLSDPVISRME